MNMRKPSTCKYCRYFNERKQYINGSYECTYHGMTTNPTNQGCYQIQFNHK